MPDFSQLFLIQESKPLKVGDQTITLVSRALRWTLPVGFGGFIWNRPIAVKIRTVAGVEHTLPIVDETRRRQLAIFAAGLAVLLVIALFLGRK